MGTDQMKTAGRTISNSGNAPPPPPADLPRTDTGILMAVAQICKQRVISCFTLCISLRAAMNCSSKYLGGGGVQSAQHNLTHTEARGGQNIRTQHHHTQHRATDITSVCRLLQSRHLVAPVHMSTIHQHFVPPEERSVPSAHCNTDRTAANLGRTTILKRNLQGIK
jgi:hypothetical protein